MKFLDLNGLTTFWTGAKNWLKDNYYKQVSGISIDGESTEIKVELDTDCTTVGSTGIVIKDASTNDTTVIYSDLVRSNAFVKNDGTKTQVLLADGSVATLNAAGGIPTLNANGKIDANKLAIDTTLFSVVTTLPTSNIVKNRIYLVKSVSTADQNIYAEYIYTGDVNATYNANKWEKLGEYQSNVDLSGYVKNTDTATASKNGVMSSSDKKSLDTLLNRYLLNIATFTASPSLVEVGASADITFAWTLGNTDFHPVTSQSISVDGAAAVTVANGTLNYKKTGLAGATSATTKKATLIINGRTSKEVSITYHYPTYVGVVAQGTTMNATAIQKLTKSIEWGRGVTKSLTQNNQVIVYAYPASYGDLTSIKDKNGFDGIGGYTKSTVAINSINYNVYVQKVPATVSNGTFIFA